jgi:hypothetical protein
MAWMLLPHQINKALLIASLVEIFKQSEEKIWQISEEYQLLIA